MTTKLEIEALSQNAKLQHLIYDVALTAFSRRDDMVGEWVKMDRSLDAYKDREQTPGFGANRLDETQRGADYADDINIPALFFQMDTLCAQINDAFFSRDRIWNFEPRTQDAVKGAKALTSAVRTAGQRFGHATALKMMARDAIKYGVGVISRTWATEEDTVFEAHNGRRTFQRRRFSGTKLTHHSPYRVISDPSIPWDQVDRHRFFGTWSPISKYEIERTYGVKIPVEDSWKWLFMPSQNEAAFVALYNLNQLDNRMTLLADLYVDLIPKDCGLGDSEKPEVWHIVACGYDRILKAEPANIPRGKYPYRTWVPDGDRHMLRPTSRLDRIKDINAMFNWLMNSRLYAIRSELDGNYVVDPLLINMRDVEGRRKSRTGNVFRLSQQAMGRPGAAKDALVKLTSSHDTKNYMVEANQLLDLMKTVTSATDVVMGQDNPSSRRTAEEIASTRQAANTRVKNLEASFHDELMVPLGQDIAQETQALLDHKILVEMIDEIGDTRYEHLVEYADLLVDVKVSVGDNFLSTDPTALANSWTELVSYVFSNPQLMSSFNLVKLLEGYGQAKGIKNINDLLSKESIAAIKAAALQQTIPPQQLLGGFNAAGSAAAIPGMAGQPGGGAVPPGTPGPEGTPLG